MKRQIFALCMVLALAMASVVLAQTTNSPDPLHPNRTASDQAYLSSGTLLPNSTGNAGATITRGGVISTSGSQPTSPLNTTSPTGHDPLHPNRTTRDQAYANGGTPLADNTTNGHTAITSSGVISSNTTNDTTNDTINDSGSSSTGMSGSSNTGVSGTSSTGVSGTSDSRSLPRTASDLPLLGLLGALSLAGALARRANR